MRAHTHTHTHTHTHARTRTHARTHAGPYTQSTTTLSEGANHAYSLVLMWRLAHDINLMALFSSLGHQSRATEQGDLHLTEGQW